MKILKRIGILVIIGLGLVAVVGLLLPTAYEVSRSVVIDAGPQKIHEYVGDVKMWDQWSPWKEEDSSLVVTPGETTTGVGASQSWACDSGEGLS